MSSYFKGQLDDLMGVLYKTEPHFIRCVVPNTHKIPGGKFVLIFDECLKFNYCMISSCPIFLIDIG